MADLNKVDPAETGFTAEELFTICVDSAYRIARSIIIQKGGELEMAVVTGVQMGADALSSDDKNKVSRDLLTKLYGRPIEELKEEQEEEKAREDAEWYSQPRFSHG